MHPIFVDILLLVAGLALLYFGSEYLVKGSARLARRLGMSPFVIGVTVVAFGTSAPEMFASVKASVDGAGGLALGNVLGSNFANICLILGLTAVIRPIPVDPSVVRRDVPIMIGITLFASAFMLDRELTRIDGAILFTGLLAYIVVNYLIGRTNPEALEHELEREQQIGLDLEHPEKGPPVWVDLLLTLGGLIGLALGADLLVRGAVDLAELAGVPEFLIGLSVVAVGTSLPELAASVQAMIRRESDIAVGNIVGSNVFNLLGVLGAAALARPIPIDGGMLVRDLPVVLAATILCLPVVWWRGRITRIEGAVFVALYAGYLTFAYLA